VGLLNSFLKAFFRPNSYGWDAQVFPWALGGSWSLLACSQGWVGGAAGGNPLLAMAQNNLNHPSSALPLYLDKENGPGQLKDGC
jgi:hypothetical protein